MRALGADTLELVNAQSGGRGEVLIGDIAMTGDTLRLNFVSKSLTNDARMVTSARTFEIKNDTLRYQMAMRTTGVNALTPHLAATLQRDR